MSAHPFACDQFSDLFGEGRGDGTNALGPRPDIATALETVATAIRRRTVTGLLDWLSDISVHEVPNPGADADGARNRARRAYREQASDERRQAVADVCRYIHTRFDERGVEADVDACVGVLLSDLLSPEDFAVLCAPVNQALAAAGRPTLTP